MLLIDKATCTMEDYLDILRGSLDIHFDLRKLKQALTDAEMNVQLYNNLARLWLRIESSGKYTTVDQNNLIDFLLDCDVNLIRRSKSTGNDTYSLDMKHVIEPLIARGVQPDVLGNYRSFRSYSSYRSTLTKLANATNYINTMPGGREQFTLPTHVEEQDNLRAYYSNINVISVPKLYSNVITTKDDKHFLAWCDFPQADWRAAYNLFIRDEKNISIMRSTEDAYEGLARLAEGDRFSEAEFKNRRKDYKVACLATFYNSKDKAEVPSLIRQCYMQSKRYRDYVFDLRTLYHFHLPVAITSYFGHTDYLPEGKYPDAFISKGLNTPIQTFTSHLVNETVYRTLHKFWDLGYTKDDINIYYVRHDEPIFQFTSVILKDAWIFREVSDIVIPGFSPIKLDFHFGDHYKEEDPVLTHEVESAIDDSMVTPLDASEVAKLVSREYHPVGRVESLDIDFMVTSSGYSLECVDSRTNEEFSVTAVGADAKEALQDALAGELGNRYRGLTYLLVRTAGLDGMFRCGDTLVKAERG